eukprot:COSAG05_NODE_660_length_8054_cov_3.180264_2_plen_85_part_00
MSAASWGKMRPGHRRTKSQRMLTEKEVQLREASNHLVGYHSQLENRNIEPTEQATIVTCLNYFLADDAVAQTPDRDHVSPTCVV